jgi:hypothetical protein
MRRGNPALFFAMHGGTVAIEFVIGAEARFG